MNRVAHIALHPVLILATPGCLLPAVERQTSDKTEMDGSITIDNERTSTDVRDASVVEGLKDAGAGSAISSAPSTDSLSTETFDASPNNGLPDASFDASPGNGLPDASADAGVCGEPGQPCCNSEPACDAELICRSRSCFEPLRVVYSHRAPGALVDTLEYATFSATSHGETQHLLARPNISSIIGSKDGSRLAFLASDSTGENAPSVVWLLDGLDDGGIAKTIASSNPAKTRTTLMADANLDFIVSCDGVDSCGTLELYRRLDQRFTTIATDVASALVGYDNGLLVYQTSESPLRVYWVDLTETALLPQLLFTAENVDHFPYIGPGMLAQAGRTLLVHDADTTLAASAADAENIKWNVYATKLGQSDLTLLYSSEGLMASYAQTDGSSVLVAPTNIKGRYTKVIHFPVTATSFGPGQELFNPGAEEEINFGESGADAIAMLPIANGYENQFHFFGAPQNTVDGTVFLTPHVLALDGSPPVATTDHTCQLFASGRDLLSPRIELSPESTAASMGWMRCNHDVGFIHLAESNSFQALASSCADCSPGKYFWAIRDGVIYSHVDANAVLTPHYYVTKGTSLELIPGGDVLGKLQSLFVADSQAQLPLWREAWHMNGSVGLQLPRSWRKRSLVDDTQSRLLAGPTVHLTSDPLTDGGIVLTVDLEPTSTAEEIVTKLSERNACTTFLGLDSGTKGAYEFYSEERMHCADDGSVRRFLALRASDHTVTLIQHDPTLTGEADFYAMLDSLSVDVSKLRRADVTPDAGAPDAQ